MVHYPLLLTCVVAMRGGFGLQFFVEWSMSGGIYVCQDPRFPMRTLRFGRLAWSYTGGDSKPCLSSKMVLGVGCEYFQKLPKTSNWILSLDLIKTQIIKKTGLIYPKLVGDYSSLQMVTQRGVLFVVMGFLVFGD